VTGSAFSSNCCLASC